MAERPKGEPNLTERAGDLAFKGGLALIAVGLLGMLVEAPIPNEPIAKAGVIFTTGGLGAKWLGGRQGNK